MSSAYIDSGDLVVLIGGANVDRYFCDDGSATASPELMNTAIAQACAVFDSDLAGSFDEEARKKLAVDDIVKMHLGWVAIHFRARSKTEWRTPDGLAAFAAEYKEARAHFKALQQGQQRSQEEPRAGTNPLVGGALNADQTPPRFIFAGTPDKPAGSGGF